MFMYIYRDAEKTIAFWPSPAPKYNRGQKPKKHGGAKAEKTIGAKAEKTWLGERRKNNR